MTFEQTMSPSGALRGLVLGMVLAAHVAGCAKHTQSTGVDGTDAGRLLAIGLDLGNAKDCKGAIEKGFDPAIALYRKEYGRSDTQYLFLRDPTEASALGALLLAQVGVDVDQVIPAAIAGETPKVSKRILVTGAEFPDALYDRGYCLSELGDLAGARASVLEALSLLPGDPMYLCEIGDQYHRQKDWAAALDVFRGVAETAAAETGAAEGDATTKAMRWQTRALRGMAFSLIEMGQLDDATAIYLNVLELDPTDAGARRELAYIVELKARAGK